MSGCCMVLGTGDPGSCPVCGEQGTLAERETLEPLLKPDQRATMIDEPYYTCHTPECDIVYFADRPLHFFDSDDLLRQAGVKESEPLVYRA